MSNYPRGTLDGVVHYCEAGYVTLKGPGPEGITRRMWFPWCMTGWKKDIVPIEKVVHKPVMVTCVRCMYIRRKR